MAESQDWKQRLADARQRAVFEPTPSGATPYVVTVERLAEVLDGVETAAAASTPSSAANTLAHALALLLREALNARLYDRNMAARFEMQPDRVDRLCDLIDAILTRDPSLVRDPALARGPTHG